LWRRLRRSGHSGLPTFDPGSPPRTKTSRGIQALRRTITDAMLSLRGSRLGLRETSRASLSWRSACDCGGAGAPCPVCNKTVRATPTGRRCRRDSSFKVKREECQRARGSLSMIRYSKLVQPLHRLPAEGTSSAQESAPPAVQTPMLIARIATGEPGRPDGPDGLSQSGLISGRNRRSAACIGLAASSVATA
jgi:hypothetical protein